MGGLDIVGTVLLACTALYVVKASFLSGIGPYKIELERVSPCKDQGDNTFNLKVEKYRSRGPRPYSLRGSLTWTFEKKQLVDISINTAIFKLRSTWTLWTKYEGKFCETLELIPDVVESFTEAIGLNSSTCPYPKGNYKFDGYWVNLSVSAVPTMPYGKYKAVSTILYKKKIQFCAEAYCDIKERHLFT